VLVERQSEPPVLAGDPDVAARKGPVGRLVQRRGVTDLADRLWRGGEIGAIVSIPPGS
jgi:hypothetical protein